MFKYKKIVLYFSTLLFMILSLIELIMYFKVDNTLFGMIYLLINLLIIFLLVPTTYNYKKYFSAARISKLIMIIIFGIFNSYILNIVVLKNISYVDDSTKFINSIFVIKNVLKGIIYFVLMIITVFEFNIQKVIVK